MPLTNAQKLQALGVSTPLAIELAAQIAANTGNFKRLQEVGMVPPLAKYVATSIDTGPMVATKAVAHSMVPDVAIALTEMVNA